MSYFSVHLGDYIENVPFSKSSELISVGQIGANWSNTLAKKNWPPELCGSWNIRQDRSLPTV